MASERFKKKAIKALKALKEQIAFPGYFSASPHRKISGKYDAGG